MDPDAGDRVVRLASPVDLRCQAIAGHGPAAGGHEHRQQRPWPITADVDRLASHLDPERTEHADGQLSSTRYVGDRLIAHCSHRCSSYHQDIWCRNAPRGARRRDRNDRDPESGLRPGRTCTGQRDLVVLTVPGWRAPWSRPRGAGPSLVVSLAAVCRACQPPLAGATALQRRAASRSCAARTAVQPGSASQPGAARQGPDPVRSRHVDGGVRGPDRAQSL